MPSKKVEEFRAELLKREAEAVQLLKDYKELFNSERGQRVLNDLKDKFGWLCPSFEMGMKVDDVDGFLREGMKQPLLHIEYCLNVEAKLPTIILNDEK